MSLAQSGTATIYGVSPAQCPFITLLTFQTALPKTTFSFIPFASTGRRLHVAPFGTDTRTVTTSTWNKNNGFRSKSFTSNTHIKSKVQHCGRNTGSEPHKKNLIKTTYDFHYPLTSMSQHKKDFSKTKINVLCCTFVTCYFLFSFNCSAHWRLGFLAKAPQP